MGVIGEFTFFFLFGMCEDGVLTGGWCGRFHFVYEFLGLPYTGVTLLPAGEVKGKL